MARPYGRPSAEGRTAGSGVFNGGASLGPLPLPLPHRGRGIRSYAAEGEPSPKGTLRSGSPLQVSATELA